MSDEKEPLPSAFPNGNIYKGNRGLTIRDYFAAEAMLATEFEYLTDGERARRAYQLADAMMAEREGK